MRDRSDLGQRGASLIEATVVTPVFLLLLFAIFEYGFLLRDDLTVASATTEAARAASTAGNTREADYTIVRALEHGLGPVDLENLELVIVFKADGPGAVPPDVCFTNPVPANVECNTYTPSDFFLPYLDDTGGPTEWWGCGATAIDRRYCPMDRESAVSAGPDYVGVFVRYRHHDITGLFGGTRMIEATAVMRVEPENR